MSDLNELPQGWKWVKFSEVVINYDGKRIPLKLTDRKKSGGKYPYYGASGIIDYIDDYIFDGEYLLISEDGANLISRSYPIAFKATGKFWVNNHSHVVKPIDKVNIDFLIYFFEISDLKPYINGSAQPKLNQSNLNSISIPLPSIDEQQRLAKLLTEKLAIIEQAKQKISAQLQAAQDLTAAYLREVFESEEAKGWEKVKFIELAVNGIINGVFKRREDFGQGIRLINVSDLYNALTININSLERVNVTEKELNLYSVEKGDLFFCRSSLKRDGIGWCAYVNEINEPVVFDCHLMRIRPDKEKLDSEYLAHYWGNPKLRNELINNSKTSTMTTMNQDDLSKIEIPLPSIDRQKELAKFFTEKMAIVEQLKITLQTQLDSINQLPAALLKQAFIGNL